LTDMRHTDQIPELDAAGLRRFGLTTGAIIGVLFGLVLPYWFGWDFPVWPWIIAAILIPWALVAPASLKQVYLNWMRFGLLLNRIVSPIILGIVFFLVVTPMGLIMRATGRNPMGKAEKSDQTTARVKSNVRDASHLEKPY